MAPRPDQAGPMIDALPPAAVGSFVLSADGGLFRGSIDDLRTALAADAVIFHHGRLRGAYPRMAGT